MIDTCIIDRSTFDELLGSTGGDMEFLSELIDDYLRDSMQELDKLRRCHAAGEMVGFQRAAHTLKSTSASFGAVQLAALAKDLELSARMGSLDGAGAKIALLVDEYECVATELEHLKMIAA